MLCSISLKMPIYSIQLGQACQTKSPWAICLSLISYNALLYYIRPILEVYSSQPFLDLGGGLVKDQHKLHHPIKKHVMAS